MGRTPSTENEWLFYRNVPSLSILIFRIPQAIYTPQGKMSVLVTDENPRLHSVWHSRLRLGFWIAFDGIALVRALKSELFNHWLHYTNLDPPLCRSTPLRPQRSRAGKCANLNCLNRGVHPTELCPTCAQDYFAGVNIDVVDSQCGARITPISATYRRAGRWEIRPENR